MPSLETIPRDVLEYIAALAGSASPSDVPHSVLALLLTSRTIHDALCPQHCPQLYASLFQSRFDFDPSRRYLDGLIDSALTAEFIQRQRLLRRVRRSNLSHSGLLQDLWTAFWMILENRNLNEAQLINAGFPGFIVEVMCMLLWDGGLHDSDETRLSIWLAALTLSNRDLKNQTDERRDEIVSHLYPFAVQDVVIPTFDQYLPHPSYTMSYYSSKRLAACPDPSLAAIILTFALRDVDILQAPPHLPLDRATAVATNRSGPTKKDYEVIAEFRTPLYADIIRKLKADADGETVDFSRQRSPNTELFNLFEGSAGPFPWTSSMLEGLWEGMYMMAPLQSSSSNEEVEGVCAKDYVCRMPMQCYIDRFQRDTSPNPFDQISERYERLNVTASLSESFENESRTTKELEDTEPHFLDRDGNYKTCAYKHRPVADSDEIFTGQTLDEHEQAWGGFRFVGRASSDGSIGLTRVQKDGAEGGGVWIFEGKICYGSVFVGRWRSSGSRGNIRGIFSMRKTAKRD